MFNLDEYTTVRERLIEFWRLYPTGRVWTELIEWSNGRFIVLAKIYADRKDEHPIATGLAHEVISDRGVNKDFALENCATSALGISLANANIGIEKHKPSREEMAKVIAKTPAKPAPQEIKEGDPDYWATPFGDHVKTTQAPKSLGEALENITAIMGTAEAVDAPSCKHGHMEFRTGHSSKTGKDWQGYFCTSKGQTGGLDKCPTIWYELTSDGKWAPQKPRA